MGIRRARHERRIQTNVCPDFFCVCCLFLFITGYAHAANLVAVNDNFGIPSSRILTVEAFGVLNNDTLDGAKAGEGGVTVTLLTSASKGVLSCPNNSALQLCTDGSFVYTAGASFDGEDTFQYQAVAITGETATATVTLSACSGGPTMFSCWHESSYLSKLSELGYNFFAEKFESPAWDRVRSPDLGAAVTAPGVTSKNIIWTTNHPLTNGISTVSGAARTGRWGGFDPAHGFATGTTIECDVDAPPISCRPHDGLSGSGTALNGVGGYFSGTTGANIAIILDGTNQINVGRLSDPGHHFFAVIDTTAAGFSEFEFRELDGKVGQELFIFADDFIIATSAAIPTNYPPVLDPVGNQSVNENVQMSILLTAIDEDRDSLSFTLDTLLPSGASFVDHNDGTASFSWTPTFNQAGIYHLNFSVADNGAPIATDSEAVTITVIDVIPDVTPPLISLLGITPVNIELGATYVDDGATALDNIDGDITTSITATSTVNSNVVGSYTVTYNVSDTAGNTAIPVVRTVNVTADATRPVITLLGATLINVELGSPYVDAGAMAFDNIDGPLAVITSNPVNVNLVGNYIITYDAMDSAGNMAVQVTRTVNVTVDATKPIITLLGTTPINIELGNAYVDAGATAFDNIDSALAVTTSNPVNVDLVGTYTVTYDAIDAAGNAAVQVTRTVNVTADVTKPVITLSGSSPVSIELGITYVDAGATASDNIDGDISVSIATTSTVNINTIGTYSVTYNVSDATGNAATPVVRTVNVTVDATKPVITLLGINPVNVELGSAYVDAGATATDNIDGSLAVTTSNPVNVDLVGTYTITYDAIDAAGNVADQLTRTVNVTAIPNSAPLITSTAVTSATENAAYSYTLTATDADGDDLTYSDQSTPTLPGWISFDPVSHELSGIPNNTDVGSFNVVLVVSDGVVNVEQSFSITVSDVNNAPLANAGADQTVFVGNTVSLDGSGSSDIDGDTLSFSWSLTSVPAGSMATLFDSTAVNPGFVVDVEGVYVAQLMINDGVADSAPDTVAISTINSAPVADAGVDQSAGVGNTVNLNGSGSSDVDGDALSFSWSLTSVPLGSTATLSDATVVNPVFVVGMEGRYVARLIVNDGQESSAPDTMTISTINSAPVANAGADQAAFIGNTVILDGSSSSDVDGDVLNYNWSFTTIPAGSTVALSDAMALIPIFVPDVPGTYVVQLIVNDGQQNSVPVTVSISTMNSAPVANAGADQSAFIGNTVTLDGSGSSDIDGDALSYIWSLTSKPATSTASLSGLTTVNPSFVIDVQGSYVAQLIANDGLLNSSPDTVNISTSNSVPVAHAGTDRNVSVGDTITLDGSGSSDADGDVLSYSWSLTSRPAGSVAALSDVTMMNPSFAADMAGIYVAQLVVNDGQTNSTPVVVRTISEPVANTGSGGGGGVDLITLLFLISLYHRNFRIRRYVCD